MRTWPSILCVALASGCVRDASRACGSNAIQNACAANTSIVRRQGGDGGNITSLVFSPDGAALAISRGELFQVWDLTPLRRRFVARAFGGPVGTLAFSADGSRVASRAANVVEIRDARSGALGERFVVDGSPESSSATTLTFAGDLLVSGPGSALAVFRADGGVLVRMIPRPPESFQFQDAIASPDGTHLAGLAGHRAFVIDVAHPGGSGHARMGRDGLDEVSWRSDGAALIGVQHFSHEIDVLDTASGDLLYVIDPQVFAVHPPVEAIAVSPNGERVALDGYDGALRVCTHRADEGRPERHTVTDCVAGSPTGRPGMIIRWSPAHAVVAASSWDDVVLWDAGVPGRLTVMARIAFESP